MRAATNKKRYAIISVIILTLLLLVSGLLLWAYLTSPSRSVPKVYSSNTMLSELWNASKKNLIEKDSGRVIDKSQQNTTTSEGQSYMMLRAVWMDDRETFDTVWKFAKNNLQRDDKLFSWKFGKKADGTYGVLTDQNGQNSASDADLDIALALAMAYQRWNESSYLYDAHDIAVAIWENEVVTVNGKPVLVANNLEKDSAEWMVLNPSYFSPYTYRILARIDNAHDWNALVEATYPMMDEIARSDLGGSKSARLMPNWVMIHRGTGEIKADTTGSHDTRYGYDAMRASWRLALDYTWFKDGRAYNLLNQSTTLRDEWNAKGKLAAVYAHDGSVSEDYESSAAYGTSMGYFSVVEPEMAKKVYEQKLLPLYTPDAQRWVNELSYYDDNWVWFGMALYNNELPNLALNAHKTKEAAR